MYDIIIFHIYLYVYIKMIYSIKYKYMISFSNLDSNSFETVNNMRINKYYINLEEFN